MVSIRDLGAIGDGITDDTIAIQAAINLVPNNTDIYFPRGMYKISSKIIISNRVGLCFESENATITSGTTRIANGFFEIINSSRISFKSLTFNQKQASLSSQYTTPDYGLLFNCPIHVSSSDSIFVDRCEFLELYTSSIYLIASSNFICQNSIFKSLTQPQGLWAQHIHIQSCSGLFSIRDCRFINAAISVPKWGVSGIFASGITGSLLIDNNKFDYCGRDNTDSHRLGVVDIYGDAENVRITNNVSTNGMAQFSRLSSVRNVIVSGNRISLSQNCEITYSTLTIECTTNFSPGVVGATDVEISNNVFEDPNSRAAYTVGAISYDWSVPLINIKILRNAFVDVKRSVLISGPFIGVKIEDNDIRGKPGSIEVVHTAAGLIVGTESNGIFDRLSLRSNTYRDQTSPNGAANALTINLNKTPTFTGKVGRLIIEGNAFRSDFANAGQSIAAIVNASVLQGRLTIRDNETEKYSNDWYVRGTKEVVIERNRAIATASSPYLDDGTNGTVQRRFNRLSTGAANGVTTLLAGTVTISTIEIRTGDVVRLSRLSLGGTPGYLSVGTITDKISFAVNSSSTNDTSTLFWEIIH